MASSQSREVIGASRKKDDAQALKEKALKAALLAVERLCSLVSDPDASNADALKAATLIFERVYQNHAGSAAAGDFDIIVKGE